MQTKHIEKVGVRRFASMNSSSGFISYFDNYFDNLSFLYILKGGPGTGKSYLMNRLADAARLKGYTVSYYHCSSDPDSLDGVIINELGVGMMDGTSPHTKDPRYPGVKEQIINLGDFWKGERLIENKNSIQFLSDEKSLYYSRAISLLSIYDKTNLECEKIISRHFDREKAYNCFLRIFKNAKTDHKPRSSPFVYESVGMLGVYAATFPKTTAIFKIPSYFSCQFLLTDCALDALHRLGISYEYSYSPFFSGRINAIYLPSSKTAIVTELDDTSLSEYKLINPKRFINAATLSPFKKELRRIKRSADPFLDEALYCFDKMRSIHFDLEDIYLSAMDLSAKEKFTDSLINKILK